MTGKVSPESGGKEKVKERIKLFVKAPHRYGKSHAICDHYSVT